MAGKGIENTGERWGRLPYQIPQEVPGRRWATTVERVGEDAPRGDRGKILPRCFVSVETG